MEYDLISTMGRVGRTTGRGMVGTEVVDREVFGIEVVGSLADILYNLISTTGKVGRGAGM
jgi:hypothetical protein